MQTLFNKNYNHSTINKNTITLVFNVHNHPSCIKHFNMHNSKYIVHVILIIGFICNLK
jgi:hypothetical protein